MLASTPTAVKVPNILTGTTSLIAKDPRPTAVVPALSRQGSHAARTASNGASSSAPSRTASR